MKQLKIYLDTNILSRIPDLNISKDTSEALAALANMGQVKFVTSAKSKEEILKTPNPHRNSVLQFLYALIEKVESLPLYYSAAIGGAPLNTVPLNGSWTDASYKKLKLIFDNNDSVHIALALKAKCDFFMTLDKKTILNRVKNHETDIKRICGSMELLSPEAILKNVKTIRKRQ